MLVLAFGAEAAQAALTVTVHVWGAGTVEDPFNGFTCASTNQNAREIGSTCTITTDAFFGVELSAVPGTTPPDNWRFSSWEGDCSIELGHPATLCPVAESVLLPGAPRTVAARFEDYRPPAVTLTEGPVGTVHDDAASFAFASDEPGGTFICRLVDEDAFDLCPGGTKAYTGLSRGQHIFEVRALDASGNESVSQQRYWTVDFDSDGDRFDHPGSGARYPIDCNDGNASVHPGAREVPENKIDEDCNGNDAPFPSIRSAVHYESKTKHRVAMIPALSVIRPPGGALVELRCRGKGCRFARRRRIASPGTSQMAFGADLRKVRLRRGAVLELWITHAGMRGKVVRLKVGRRGKVSATTLCLQPGAKKPTRCSAR
jgi:hypothetical protein